MFATFYSYKNRVNEPEPLIKKPGEIDGQMFDISDCEGMTIIIMDNCEQVQIDNVKNSRIFIGACASSIFIRNCEGCTFYTACRQLRLREVTKSKFYIYSMAEVHIEYSNSIQFGPFNGGYPEQAKHLEYAKLPEPQNNLWYDIFDHNDPAKTHANWSLIPESEYEDPWYPAGECTPAIPRTKAGSVVRVDDNSMQSFSAQQLVEDAVKASPAKKAASPVVSPTKGLPPAPAAAPAAAPVPPPAPPAVEVNEETKVVECLTAYANFKAGDSLEFGVPELSIVLSSGLNTTLAEVAQEHVSREMWHVESVVISSNREMAWAVFWQNISGITIARNTAVLMNAGGAKGVSKWQLVHVQASSPTALSELPVPKKLTL